MENFENHSNKNNFSTIHVVLICISVAAIAFGLIYLSQSNIKKNKEEIAKEQAFIDSLHVFPEIEFADSLYAKVNLKKYDNDNETPRDVVYYKLDSLGNPTNEAVHETHFYENEQKYIDGNIKNEQRDGLWYAYYPDGTVQTKAFYKNGVEDGRYTVYYQNGNIRYTGVYENGKKIGEWRFYREDGSLERTVNN